MTVSLLTERPALWQGLLKDHSGGDIVAGRLCVALGTGALARVEVACSAAEAAALSAHVSLFPDVIRISHRREPSSGEVAEINKFVANLAAVS